MGRPIVNRFKDAAGVVESVASDLFTFVSNELNIRHEVHIALTGGTVGIASLAAAKQLPFATLDLQRLHIWWGDERYVASDSEDRNAIQARRAWLNSLGMPEVNVHEFPSSDSGLSASKAAKNFAEFFESMNVKFDLMLMGMGPDGHIASIFPGSTAELESKFVFAEIDSPKPPRERLSFNYSVINDAREIWFTVAGADKAEAVSEVFSEEQKRLPAANVTGKKKTVWYVDQTAGNLVWGC